jgi:hypothetical protein
MIDSSFLLEIICSDQKVFILDPKSKECEKIDNLSSRFRTNSWGIKRRVIMEDLRGSGRI